MSSRMEDDISEFSEDDDGADDGMDDQDSKTRRKGEALYKRIGSMYKSLNMDTQSLRKTFLNTNAPTETELDDSSALSSSDASSQLSFMEALLNWVESQNLFNDKSTPEADQFTKELVVWRRGPSRRICPSRTPTTAPLQTSSGLARVTTRGCG